MWQCKWEGVLTTCNKSMYWYHHGYYSQNQVKMWQSKWECGLKTYNKSKYWYYHGYNSQNQINVAE
jgi:hypothetical protein